MSSAVRMADGSFDFSGGIDSQRVTTVQSQSNPNGLPRNMLAWLTNGTVRDGGITQRTGWQNIINRMAAGALFQGGYLYVPDFADPYLIFSIGGNILQVLVEAPFTVTNLSKKFNLFNPATVAQAFFEQGEEFLVIQAGDVFTNPKPTLPLFWDGNTLRRSVGIISANNTPTGGITPFNELPAAGPMSYYQGRLWYAIGRTYTAGDIVNGPAGTAQYNERDSILKVTENPLALGGDGFTVPSSAGNITALAYTANLDTSLGQGPLYVFTRRQVYSLVVPVSRTAWIAANNTNQPAQTVAQIKYGSTSDRCVVHVNGDLFYQSLEPAIRSLFISTRYFQQWANRVISRNEDRALAFNNRALMPFATGINFDNRLLMGILPVQTPVGVAFQAIAPLDFDIISQFGQELVNNTPATPAWEGIYEGLDILQLFEGDFGGLERAFAVTHSRLDDSIGVWEITDFLTVNLQPPADNPVGTPPVPGFVTEGTDTAPTNLVEQRVDWFFETPAFTWGKEFEMKELDGAEIWVDSISGTVEMTVQYRVDADPCWQTWARTEFCAARNSCEDASDPFCSNYPLPTFCQGFKFPVVLQKPRPNVCEAMSGRPTNIGYQFQMKVTLKGYCRIRGIIMFALPRERQPFLNVNCN